MRLKRVKIVGFKTFADRTEFELDGDVIAVVGPNGCGKSNIVDAVLWGLGETNARSLRAQTGKEVIFAGSSQRKPVGYAEVTLVFDNEDGQLPIESAEVAVTRRITRGGDGDYAINRRSCRMKDLHDLLADSGLGRAGYAIVGQSEIDQALGASPTQRRAWIDEAAGVHRYRARRVEAQRRLDSSEAHLARVHDVVSELESQMKPLAREAEVARRYREVANALREVESGLLAREFSSLGKDVSAAMEAAAEARAMADKEGGLAADCDERAVEAATRAEQLGRQLEADREALRRASVEREQAEAAINVARSRIEGLHALEANLEEEGAAHTERERQAEEDVAAALSEVEARSAAVRECEGQAKGNDAQGKALAEALRQAEKALAEAREAAEVRRRAEVERAHRDARAEEVERELEGVDQSLPDLRQALAEAERSLSEAEATIQEAESEAHALKEERAALGEQLAELAKRLRDVLAESAALEGRRRGIESTIAAHEGLSQGSRAVLDLVRQGALPDRYRPVGEALRTEPANALAIDTALGAAANDLITPGEKDAKAAIEALKRDRLGRATFQPLDLVRPRADRGTGPTGPGVVGRASELVACEASVRAVVDSLLGNVTVVETLADALRLARTKGWSRLVTLDGEVVHASGAVTGGRALRTVTGLVQRRAELDETLDQIDGAEAEAEALRAEEQRLAEEAERIEAQLAEVARRREADSASREDARAWLASVRHELNGCERDRDRLATERDSLRAATLLEAVEVDLPAAEARRDEAWKAVASHSEELRLTNERLKEHRDHLGQAEARLAEAKRRLIRIKESESAREKRRDDLGPQRERQEATIKEAEATRQRAEEEAARLQAQTEEREKMRTAALDEAGQEREAAFKARHTASEAERKANEHEVARARAEARRQASLERLLSEYGIDEAEADRLACETELPAEASSTVATLRREIRAMGDVNLGAIEAYERLSERHGELTAQTADIEQGRAEILAAVRELDRLTAEKFREAFDRVREEFATTFVKLFGGGQAELRLVSDEEADGEEGVEIEVTVPGKKRQRLALLSGGERAMAALAFLFALLRVRPSPLVVLDEVDAPLDGRNVERFVSLLREFSGGTQFLLITHNPMTIESADVWFGVTMQEPGVSTVVPFKAPPKASVA
ncbi:MAG: chromosome segregation protein SMC [Fimbriimonadaceae bacterium]|nr:chromosome segregation protein SMC [Fimbriimonadaceae bacterium]QYK55270.1 MAG: chromosome segregation protein SMC [Fimbriimonadaceae bacterium]